MKSVVDVLTSVKRRGKTPSKSSRQKSQQKSQCETRDSPKAPRRAKSQQKSQSETRDSPKDASAARSKKKWKPKNKWPINISAYDPEYEEFQEEQRKKREILAKNPAREGTWHNIDPLKICRPSRKDKWVPKKQKYADAFIKHYAELGEDGVKAEFKREVEGYKSPKFEHRFFDENPTKNRGKDVTCMDDSRVEFNDDKKKYIDASWMYDLQHLDRKYIVTQFPLPDTTEDFWLMVYEKKALCIVAFELGDALKIWPKTSKKRRMEDEKKIDPPMVFGSMTVRTCEEDWYPMWSGDMVEITRNNSDERHVVHVAFWGSPSWQYLQQISRVERKIGDNHAELPIVLMDPDLGLGNASICVAVDVVGSLLFKGTKISVPNVVKWVRKCRNGAINNEKDYLSIVQLIFQFFHGNMKIGIPESLKEHYNMKVPAKEPCPTPPAAEQKK